VAVLELMRAEAADALQGIGSAARTTHPWGIAQPAREMKPPTTVPYATWATTLTSGVWGP
jgi:hypothetical protein